MPYIITTKRMHAITNKPGCDDWLVSSRRAVATLEEAKGRVQREASEHLNGEWWSREHARALEQMPESGGTVGPLPDGTVIEVERVSIHWLAAESSCNTFYGDTEAEIIDAYNARQATAV